MNIPEDVLYNIYICVNKKPTFFFSCIELYQLLLKWRRQDQYKMFGPHLNIITIPLIGKGLITWKQWQKNILDFHSLKRKPTLTLPPTTNSFIRFLAHQLCDVLGLLHHSFVNNKRYRKVCSQCKSNNYKTRRGDYSSDDEMECLECNYRCRSWRGNGLDDIEEVGKSITIKRVPRS
jgi:hypothetical protein